ncbi:hypothetical protein [Sphingomonas sp. PB4P5]|uniref:hypothetical protein n=1 Tax=Parasphingomonas puruogangriensis TaxID=3096155 RepID=UPI002FC65B12
MSTMITTPPDDPKRNPLHAAWQRRHDLRHEIDLLRNQTDVAILAMARSVPGFEELERIYGFGIDRWNPDTLQLSFGHRSMFRPTVDRKRTASETGPTLVYSFGDAGIVTVLYPAKSDLAQVHEDHLFLQIGATSGSILLEGMRRDVQVLVAYAEVTSIDLAALWRARLRIWILQLLCARSQNGKFRKPPLWGKLVGLVGFGSRTLATASLLSVLKPLGLAILIALLAKCGLDWLKPA